MLAREKVKNDGICKEETLGELAKRFECFRESKAIREALKRNISGQKRGI